MAPELNLASDPLQQALCPLAFQTRRDGGTIIGRKAELAAIESELAAALQGLSAVALEGEPGIGKTRLVLAACELASGRGFVPLAVAADEELRGPFLLLRSLLASAGTADVAEGTRAQNLVRPALEALSGRPDIALDTMPPEQRLLRQFDLAAMALRELAAIKPLAIFADDVQWADEDSLRALRYLVRTAATSPMFVLLAMRPEESAAVTEAVTLVADLERMGMIRRFRPDRFSQMETLVFLLQQLGGEADGGSAATLHVQSEGVRFILEELTHAYRDAAMLQQIDGRLCDVGGGSRWPLQDSSNCVLQRRCRREKSHVKELCVARIPNVVQAAPGLPLAWCKMTASGLGLVCMCRVLIQP